MQRLREDILDLGQADGHVLIDGETGTGKTLIAHALHAVGAKARKPFVLLSCAAWRGRLRRAVRPDRRGRSALPLVEEARGRHAGAGGHRGLARDVAGAAAELDQRPRHAAGNADRGDLEPAAAGPTCEDMLRPDLYFRLAAMKITLPPLRNRGEDILSLFSRYSEQFAEEYGCDAPDVTAQEAAQLLQAPWPGNVRQLMNVAERAVLQARRGTGSIASLLMADSDDLDPRADDRGQAAEGICRGLRADADRQHHAAAQGVDRRGDGRAVPAAADAEREDGEIRPERSDYL
jgi:DNA-binding NtrC family response regulator